MSTWRNMVTLVSAHVVPDLQFGVKKQSNAAAGFALLIRQNLQSHSCPWLRSKVSALPQQRPISCTPCSAPPAQAPHEGPWHAGKLQLLRELLSHQPCEDSVTTAGGLGDTASWSRLSPSGSTWRHTMLPSLALREASTPSSVATYTRGRPLGANTALEALPSIRRCQSYCPACSSYKLCAVPARHRTSADTSTCRSGIRGPDHTGWWRTADPAALMMVMSSLPAICMGMPALCPREPAESCCVHFAPPVHAAREVQELAQSAGMGKKKAFSKKNSTTFSLIHGHTDGQGDPQRVWVEKGKGVGIGRPDPDLVPCVPKRRWCRQSWCLQSGCACAGAGRGAPGHAGGQAARRPSSGFPGG